MTVEQPSERRGIGDARIRFSRGVVWSILGGGAGRGLTLLASMAVARILGPAGFGGWGVTQSGIATAAAFAGLGAGLTATKGVAGHRNTDPVVAGARAALALSLAGMGGLVMAIILAVASGPIARSLLYAPALAPLLALGAGALVCGTLNGAQLGVLAGLEEFGAMCAVTVARGAAVTAMMTAGAVLGGAAGAVAGLSLGEFIGAVAGQLAVHDRTRRAGVPLSSRSAWRERSIVWRFSLPAMGASLAVQPAIWIGQIALVRQPNGLVEAGYFAFAYRWYLFMTFFATSLAPLGLPILANLVSTANRETQRRFVRMNLRANVIAVVIPVGVVGLLAPLVVDVGGGAYRPAMPALLVLALASVPTALNNVLSQAALGIGCIRAWVISDIVLAFGLAAVSVALAPSLGSAAVALGYLAGMVATCVVLIGPIRAALRGPEIQDAVG